MPVDPDPASTLESRIILRQRNAVPRPRRKTSRRQPVRSHNSHSDGQDFLQGPGTSAAGAAIAASGFKHRAFVGGRYDPASTYRILDHADTHGTAPEPQPPQIALLHAALEARASRLERREAALLEEEKELRERESACEELEMGLRRQRAEFLAEISSREHSILELEQKYEQLPQIALETREEAARHAVHIQNLKLNVQAAKEELERLKAEQQLVAQKLSDAKAERTAALAETEQALETRDQFAVEIQELQERLKAFQLQLETRERDVADHEKQLADYASAMCSEMEALRRKHSAAKEQQRVLTEKAQDLNKREEECRRREAAAKESRDRANQLSREVSQRLETIETDRSDFDRALTELERRENGLCTRETLLLEKETALKRKEHEARNMQDVLHAREQSISRSNSAIAARERAVDEKASMLAAREEDLDRREREMAAIETAARSREIELETREARLERMAAELSENDSRLRLKSSKQQHHRDTIADGEDLLQSHPGDERSRASRSARTPPFQKQKPSGSRILTRIFRDQPVSVSEDRPVEQSFPDPADPSVEMDAFKALWQWIESRSQVLALTKTAILSTQALQPFCFQRRASGALARVLRELTSLLNAIECAGHPTGSNAKEALENEIRKHREWHEQRQSKLRIVADIGLALQDAQNFEELDQKAQSAIYGIVQKISSQEDVFGQQLLNPTSERVYGVAEDIVLDPPDTDWGNITQDGALGTLDSVYHINPLLAESTSSTIERGENSERSPGGRPPHSPIVPENINENDGNDESLANVFQTTRESHQLNNTHDEKRRVVVNTTEQDVLADDLESRIQRELRDLKIEED